MALKSDDSDLRKTWIRTSYGGNGDYYIEMWLVNDDGLKESYSVRVATSGGNCPGEVKSLIAKLHWEMEKHGLNEYPDDEF
jgi:hypothetical protein